MQKHNEKLNHLTRLVFAWMACDLEQVIEVGPCFEAWRTQMWVSTHVCHIT